jgi:hypothetical protein
MPKFAPPYQKLGRVAGHFPMTLTVNYALSGQPPVTEELQDVDIDQTAADFVSAFLSAQGIPPGDFFLSFQGQQVPEQSTLRENGITGNSEELRLVARNIPAAE